MDPYNLGPAVYKIDQVITLDDIRKIINELVAIVAEMPLDSKEVERFDAALATLTNLYDWLKMGKPDTLSPSGEING